MSDTEPNPAPPNFSVGRVIIGLIAALTLIGLLVLVSGKFEWFEKKFAVGLTGPSVSAMDDAVNWSLSARIRGDGKLYQDYKIVNHYTREIRLTGEKWHVIEYSADCSVASGDKVFTGTVALAQRGNRWVFNSEIQ